MTALPVMKQLHLLKARVRQFEPGLTGSAVQEFRLHAPPERLDHAVVVTLSGQTSTRRRLAGHGLDNAMMESFWSSM